MNNELMVESTKSLITHYEEEKLIEIAKNYKELLDNNDIEVNLWVDAIEELIMQLENDDTTIESVLSEAALLISKHNVLLSDYKKSKEIGVKSLLCAPIFLLQVVYLFNHTDFDGDIFEVDNSKFNKILEDK